MGVRVVGHRHFRLVGALDIAMDFGRPVLDGEREAVVDLSGLLRDPLPRGVLKVLPILFVTVDQGDVEIALVLLVDAGQFGFLSDEWST